jgi:ribosomal protein S18 acetylase RimI-like enzyme
VAGHRNRFPHLTGTGQGAACQYGAVGEDATNPGQFIRRPAAHPEHDAVTREVSGWFTSSAPEIGYEVSEHWYGYHSDLGPGQARVILRVGEPGQVQAALADAAAASGAGTLTIWVDDRERAALLDGALRSAGCRPGEATTHLALVGPMTGRTDPGRLVVESVDETGLPEWAAVKLQSFGDTESAPAPDRLAEEVAARRSELALAECQLGLLGGERVAVLAYYCGHDQLVFNLGTRVPFRHRGIAQAMLAHWVDAGMADGCRSLIINATDGDAPAALYRRIGFTDEIYWYRKYELSL